MNNKKNCNLNFSIFHCILVFALEAIFLLVNFYGAFFRFQQAVGVEFIIGFIPVVIRIITIPMLFLVGFIFFTNWNNFRSRILININVVDVIIQLVAYFLFVGLLLLLDKFEFLGVLGVFYFTLFIAIWILLIFLSIKIFIDVENLLFAIKYFKYFFLAGAISLFLDQIFSINNAAIESYFHYLLFEPTAALSKYFLGVMGYKVFIDENIFKIYVDNFSGEIAASCLGYQGASLGLLFLCGYLYVMRKDFRFPQALVVLPLAVLALWLLNSVRIALLLAVGSSWSEDIATNGFHRVGGWINLIGVSSLMLFILHRTSWLSTVNRQNLTLSVNKENIKLLPQLTLIATTILSLLFTGQFDWLYPVRILIVGFVLIYTCKKTNFKLMRPDFVTVLLGLFIFIVWMMLVPSFPEKDAEFSNAISKAPDMLFYVWIFFRVVGAVVVVPLSEELAFRGFVVDRLKSQLSPSVGVNIHHFLIGLISSVAFGLLHEAWVAGIIAGLVFYYAINRRSQISDAVVVHAIVNLLISIYVLTTHEWSYW